MHLCVLVGSVKRIMYSHSNTEAFHIFTKYAPPSELLSTTHLYFSFPLSRECLMASSKTLYRSKVIMNEAISFLNLLRLQQYISACSIKMISGSGSRVTRDIVTRPTVLKRSRLRLQLELVSDQLSPNTIRQLQDGQLKQSVLPHNRSVKCLGWICDCAL